MALTTQQEDELVIKVMHESKQKKTQHAQTTLEVTYEVQTCFLELLIEFVA